MELNIPEGLEIVMKSLETGQVWFVIKDQTLYEGGAPIEKNELNPAYTNVRKRLEDYRDLELRGTKILLNGRGQLELNFKKDLVEVSQKTASGFFDTYTKVAEVKYVDPYTNRQSIRLNTSEHEDTLKLIAFLLLEKLEQQADITKKAANDNEAPYKEERLAA